MTKFTFTPQGPFDLLHQNQYFNGWPTLDNDDTTIVMAFPVEGWQGSAAVMLHQNADQSLAIEVAGTADVVKARDQALAAMSADEDGNGWVAVGQRDKFVGELQATYGTLRPTKFHSPYEAAAHFMIGHRISVKQARVIRVKLAEVHGEAIEIAGQTVHAFPSPQKLLEINEFPGISELKFERLHAMAQAALDGMVDSNYLQSLPEPEALKRLEELPGVGPFFSQGILNRGAGRRDDLTHEDVSFSVVAKHYNEGHDLTQAEFDQIAEAWRPYRMWVVVLMHVWAFGEPGRLPARTFSK